MIEIRRAVAVDWAAIWPIFQAVVSTGDSFAQNPDTPEAEAFALWMSPATATYVAVEGDHIVGSYLIKPNQPGLGSHVANAAFMVAPGRAGHGIGRAMGLHALREAKEAGYAAMQFNFVIRTNTHAVALWQSLGFVILATLPKAFRHQQLGLVDAYLMHRFLDP